MEDIINRLYSKYLFSNRNVHIITNEIYINNFTKIEHQGKIFMRYFNRNRGNSFIITQKGLFIYDKGNNFNIDWADFKELSIGYDRNCIFLTNLLIYVNKPKKFYSFFKELQRVLKSSIKTDEEALELLAESRIEMDMIEQKLDFYISLLDNLTHIKSIIRRI